jgi:BirA family biotin operon repressor/biotin-[acetyl-CoA-carboxylase] ligase
MKSGRKLSHRLSESNLFGMDWRIHHKSVTESTNKDALGGKPGDVFVADMQTAGRGRLDHKWLSAPGENLMMSAVVDVADVPPQEAATLPLMAGLAVAQAVSGVFSRSGNPSKAADVKIKWPNDVLIAGRKICGILCERSGDSVIVGIGVNVNQTAFPPEISHRATSLRLELGFSHDVDSVRDGVLDRLSECIERWRQNGFAALLPELSTFDCLKGQRVAVRRTDDDGAPADGLCGGIRPDGMLDVAGEAISAGEAHVVA